MKRCLALIIAAGLALAPSLAQGHDAMPDTRKLGMALDYFAGGKYHEALMMFMKLDKKYKLNPRFKAYIGICHYHEWDYEEACRYLDEAIPHLDAYSPNERSVYYGAAAESHFELGEYGKAIPLYERLLLVCRGNERGDALFRLGCCYMLNEAWGNAAEYFRSALAYYTRYPRTDRTSRISQLKNMLRGCEEKISESGQGKEAVGH